MTNFKKFKNLFLIIFISVLLGFFSAISFSQIEIKPIQINSSLVSSEREQKEFLLEVIDKVKKDYVEEKTDKELIESAANGLLSSLDPHSAYLNEDDFKEINVQTKGEFGGVGIEITMEYSLVKVISAIEGTPAHRVGIKSGDYISKVDDKTVVGLNIGEVVKKLRGKPGSNVEVTILRKGENAPIVKKIKREIIKIVATRSAKFKDVGYVKVNSFSQQAHQGVIDSIKKLKKEIGEDKIKGFILDLRDNPGGLLDQAVSISDIFLDEGRTIVSISGRNKEEAKYFKDQNKQQLAAELPIVVLINEGSASASEIVAAALQDNKRAIIMGKKSFGKGSVQTVLPLNKNNGALRMTTALYYTPSGKSIQAHGVEPDIEVGDVKVEKKEEVKLSSESDLKGHIQVQIQEAIEEAKREKISDDNFELYEKDYQLARAIDLVRGIGVYKLVVKK
jgi:carboxyl-terminal processing protease